MNWIVDGLVMFIVFCLSYYVLMHEPSQKRIASKPKQITPAMPAEIDWKEFEKAIEYYLRSKNDPWAKFDPQAILLRAELGMELLNFDTVGEYNGYMKWQRQMQLANEAAQLSTVTLHPGEEIIPLASGGYIFHSPRIDKEKK